MVKRLFSYFIVLAMVLGVVGILMAVDVPTEIMIDNKVYKTDKKGPVKLTHQKHIKDYNVSCTECHHVYKNGKNVWKEGDPIHKCKECHDPAKKKGKVRKLKNAYHKNCKSCHKKMIAKGKKAPFKKCNQCHQKKKK